MNRDDIYGAVFISIVLAFYAGLVITLFTI